MARLPLVVGRGRDGAQLVPTSTAGHLARVLGGATYAAGFWWVDSDWPRAFHVLGAVVVGAFTLVAARDLLAWWLASAAERRDFLVAAAAARAEVAAKQGRRLVVPVGLLVVLVLGFLASAMAAVLTREPIVIGAAAVFLVVLVLTLADRLRSR